MTCAPVVLPGLAMPMREAWVCVQEDTLAWGGVMLLERHAWTDEGAADAWLTAYNDARPPRGGERRYVVRLSVGGPPPPVPQPGPVDNPDDDDPLDGRFDTSRVEGIEL